MTRAIAVPNFVIGAGLASVAAAGPIPRLDFVAPAVGLQDSRPATTSAPVSAPTSNEAADGEAEEGADSELPIAFSISYSLLSDYLSRGINYSDYPNERRDRANHQVNTSLEFDLAMLAGRKRGEFGVFSFETFFEWFAGQQVLTPLAGEQHLQEIHWTFGYSYEIKPIATTAGVKYVYIVAPTDTQATTTEIDFIVEHNDAWMWKWLLPDNTDPVLSPSFLYAYDWDEAKRGSWFEFGFKHDFEIVKDVTVTPSLTLGVDHGYIGGINGVEYRERNTELAYTQFGLTVSYDMTKLIGLDKWGYGNVLLSGFIYYNEVPQRVEREGFIRDTLWGGMSIGWSF